MNSGEVPKESLEVDSSTPHLLPSRRRTSTTNFLDLRSTDRGYMKIKQGTWSVLLGCYSPIHSLLVFIAWIKLYHSLPSWWQVICILIHDIGHWGKDYLDDYEEKKKHGELGAKIAKWLFGQKGYDLVIGHNLYTEVSKSALHDPDKYSWTLAPIWYPSLMLMIALLSRYEAPLRN